VTKESKVTKGAELLLVPLADNTGQIVWILKDAVAAWLAAGFKLR